ncbi:MAG: hypothetical protein ACYC3X_18550 [Pirellulaceae bacterium]
MADRTGRDGAKGLLRLPSCQRMIRQVLQVAFDAYAAADALYQPAMEARTPLLAAASSGPAGSLPVTQSGVVLSRSGVAVTAFGPNPDGPGTLVRLWAQAGQGGDCSVQLPAGMHVSSVQPVDLRGRPRGAPIPVHNNAFTFPHRRSG